MSDIKKCPPTERGQGRKSVSSDDGISAIWSVRIGQARIDKAMRLGGAEWLRKMIDKAREQK
jgi:hypothetical protein